MNSRPQNIQKREIVVVQKKWKLNTKLNKTSGHHLQKGICYTSTELNTDYGEFDPQSRDCGSNILFWPSFFFFASIPLSRICMSHVTYMKESCRTYE